jgi:hypothetical protein
MRTKILILCFALYCLAKHSLLSQTNSDLQHKAEQGDAWAQFGYALTLINGNSEEAAKWLEKAANQGQAEAQSLLGRMYWDGRGVPKSESLALKWYSLAANQGEQQAQAALGYRYANGLGVRKSLVEAYKWWLLAANQGNDSAKRGISQLNSLMENDKIAEAQRLAATFTAKLRISKAPALSKKAPDSSVVPASSTAEPSVKDAPLKAGQINDLSLSKSFSEAIITFLDNPIARMDFGLQERSDLLTIDKIPDALLKRISTITHRRSDETVIFVRVADDWRNTDFAVYKPHTITVFTDRSVYFGGVQRDNTYKVDRVSYDDLVKQNAFRYERSGNFEDGTLVLHNGQKFVNTSPQIKLLHDIAQLLISKQTTTHLVK